MSCSYLGIYRLGSSMLCTRGLALLERMYYGSGDNIKCTKYETNPMESSDVGFHYGRDPLYEWRRGREEILYSIQISIRQCTGTGAGSVCCDVLIIQEAYSLRPGLQWGFGGYFANDIGFKENLKWDDEQAI